MGAIDERCPQVVRQVEVLHSREDRLAHAEGGLSGGGGECDADGRIGLQKRGQHDHDGPGLARSGPPGKQKQVPPQSGPHGQALILIHLRSEGLSEEIQAGSRGFEGRLGQSPGESPGDFAFILEIATEVESAVRGQDEGKVILLAPDATERKWGFAEVADLPGFEVAPTRPGPPGKAVDHPPEDLGILRAFPLPEEGGQGPAELAQFPVFLLLLLFVLVWLDMVLLQ